MSIREELLAVQAASADGLLHCAEVVEWAKANPTSSLHAAIQWNNATAADAYRLWQVRQLIQLHVVSEDFKETMVSLSIDRKAGGGYRSVSDVVARPDLREIMLQDALNELERLRHRYGRVKALATVWREVDDAQVKTGRRRRVEVVAEQMAAAE